MMGVRAEREFRFRQPDALDAILDGIWVWGDTVKLASGLTVFPIEGGPMKLRAGATYRVKILPNGKCRLSQMEEK